MMHGQKNIKLELWMLHMVVYIVTAGLQRVTNSMDKSALSFPVD